MATGFPTTLDTLTNPVASDAMNSATVPHAAQHANANDAIEALQAKVGADGSAVASSLDYKIAQRVVSGGALGTPSGGTLTNCTGLPAAGVSGTALVAAAIGATVQGYDADTAKTDVPQNWTAQQTFQELKDTVHTITDGAAFEIDPANGSVQVVTLGANRTPAATNFEAGQAVWLGINDGTTYSVTWTDATWGAAGTGGGNGVLWNKPGGTASAPTLADTGYTWILLWKVGTQVYGGEGGKP